MSVKLDIAEKWASEIVKQLDAFLLPSDAKLNDAKNKVDEIPLFLLESYAKNKNIRLYYDELWPSIIDTMYSIDNIHKRFFMLSFANPYIVQLELKMWLSKGDSQLNAEKFAYIIISYTYDNSVYHKSQLPPVLFVFTEFVRKYAETGIAKYKYPFNVMAAAKDDCISALRKLDVFGKEDSDYSNLGKLLDLLSLPQTSREISVRYKNDAINNMPDDPYSQIILKDNDTISLWNKQYGDQLEKNKVIAKMQAVELNCIDKNIGKSISDNEHYGSSWSKVPQMFKEALASVANAFAPADKIEKVYPTALRAINPDDIGNNIHFLNIAVTGQKKSGKSTWINNVYNLIDNIRLQYSARMSWNPFSISPTKNRYIDEAMMKHFNSESWLNKDKNPLSESMPHWFAKLLEISSYKVLLQVIDIPGEWFSEKREKPIQEFVAKACRSVDCIIVMHPSFIDGAANATQNYFKTINTYLQDYPTALRPEAAIIFSKIDKCLNNEDKKMFYESPNLPNEYYGDMVAMNSNICVKDIDQLYNYIDIPSLNGVSNYMLRSQIKDLIINKDCWFPSKNNSLREAILNNTNNIRDKTIRHFQKVAGNADSLFGWPHLTLGVTGSIGTLKSVLAEDYSANQDEQKLQRVHVHNTLLALLHRAYHTQHIARMRRAYWIMEDSKG